MHQHELTDEEWEIVQPLLAGKSRGVPRVDDRPAINGILWRFRTGSPRRDVSERYGPRGFGTGFWPRFQTLTAATW